MARQTTVRLPAELADTAEVLARARGLSINKLIINALEAEIHRASNDPAVLAKVRSHAARDRKVYDRLLVDTAVREWTTEEFFADAGPPTSDDLSISPDGAVLDTPEKLRKHLDNINAKREAE